MHEAVRTSGITVWQAAAPQAGVAWLVVTLLTAVRASGSITDERERGTWDAVLLTPLTTRVIVRGKFRGLLMAVGWYVLAYALATLPLALILSAEAFVTTAFATGAMVVFTPWAAAV